MTKINQMTGMVSGRKPLRCTDLKGEVKSEVTQKNPRFQRARFFGKCEVKSEVKISGLLTVKDR